MQRRSGPILCVTLIVALLLTALVPLAAARSGAQTIAPAAEFAPGRLLVKFRPLAGADAAREILTTHHLEVIRQIPGLNVLLVSVPPGQEMATIRQLKRNLLVQYAEPDYILHAFNLTPNDPYYATDQWNLPQINAPAAWDLTTGSGDVVVAVVDTGVDLSHPDLGSKIVAGYDFVNDDSTPQDDEGHGTHVAGIAAAVTNNGVGVAGVSWGSSIMPVKVLDNEGSGYLSDVADGIRWAADHGAKIINMSLGGPGASSTLQNAVDYAYGRGLLIVAAAGNEYQHGNPVSYPAAYPHVMAVAATNDQDNHASYSNTGYYVDIAAPGGDPSGSGDTNARHWIRSTYWRGASSSGYARLAGTSMATPHLAGLAALVWSRHPSWTNDQVEWVIESTAIDRGDTGRDDVFGWGRIDARAAVALDTVPPTPTPTPSNCLAESPHPYSNDMNQTWTVTNPDTAATTSRVHFSRIELETNYDFIIIRDANGNEIQRLTGSYTSGIWSNPVPGRTVQVQLTTDYSITAWGFCLDQIETTDVTPTPTPTPTTTPGVCLAETAHPYADNTNQTWTVTNPDTTASYSKVHFSRLETEPGYDVVIIKDGSGTEIQRLTGSYPNGLWSSPVPGRTVQVQLTTDSSVTAWGFCLDLIQTSPPPAWAVRAPMSVARSRLAVAAVNGKIYAIGGESPGSAMAAKGQEPSGPEVEMAGVLDYIGAVEEYNPTTNAWTTKAPMPTPLSNIAAGVINNKIYVPGGYDGTTDSAALQIYDPALNSWTTAAPLPVARSGPAVAVAGGKLYVFGGKAGSSYLNTCYRYDPATNSWTQRASMTYARAWAAAGVVNGKIYVVGGIDDSSEFNYVEEYDPVTDRWTTKAPLSVPRGGPGAAGVGDYLYVVGGGWTGYLNSAERYNPATNTWETIDSMNIGRRTLGLADLDGKLYAVGGWNGAYSAANEAYTLGGPAPQPDIEVSPTSLSATLAPGGTTQQTLTIRNMGQAALSFSISEVAARGSALPKYSNDTPALTDGLAICFAYPGQPANCSTQSSDVTWLSESPTSGMVAAGSSQAVNVTFNAVGLTPGTYRANLIIASNDPDEAQVTVPVTLTVRTSGEQVTISVNPASKRAGVGEIFTLDLLISSGQQLVDAADAFVSFDPARLHVVDANGNDTNSITPGTALALVLLNNANNSQGRITFSAGRQLGGTPPSGNFVLATIRFKAMAETGTGGTPVHFLSGTDVFYQGNSILQGTNDGVVIVEQTSLTGRVTLQGRGNPPSSRWQGYPIRVTFYAPGSTTPLSSSQATLDSSGVFTVAGVGSGTYDIAVKNPHTLSNRKANVTLPGGTNPIDFGTLLEGDANDNDRVAGEDFSILVTAYGTSTGQPGWDARADFNGDGTIGGADFSLLATNYGRQGPLPVSSAQAGTQGLDPLADQKVNLYIAPTSSMAGVGSVFALNVVLQAGSQTVDSADAYLTFDRSYLRVVDEAGNEATGIVPGSALPLVLQNSADNSKGRITFSAGRQLTGTPPSGDFVLATIRFKAINATGLEGTSVAFAAGTDVFSQGNSVLGTRGDGVVLITTGGRFLYIPGVRTP